MFRAVTGAGMVAAAAVTLPACPTTTFHSTRTNPAAGSLNLGGMRVAALILSEEEALPESGPSSTSSARRSGPRWRNRAYSVRLPACPRSASRPAR